MKDIRPRLRTWHLLIMTEKNARESCDVRNSKTPVDQSREGRLPLRLPHPPAVYPCWDDRRANPDFAMHIARSMNRHLTFKEECTYRSELESNLNFSAYKATKVDYVPLLLGYTAKLQPKRWRQHCASKKPTVAPTLCQQASAPRFKKQEGP